MIDIKIFKCRTTNESNNFDRVIDALKKAGIKVSPGLSPQEIGKTETYFNIKFHPDHQKLLMAGLITGQYGYDWQDFSDKNVARIKQMLNWPLEGILFDIANGEYWNDKAGKKPADPVRARKMFTDWYNKKVPQLVPIYSHRYMCSTPE